MSRRALRYSYAEQGFTLWRLGSVAHSPERCGCLACADARAWDGRPPLDGMLPPERATTTDERRAAS